MVSDILKETESRMEKSVKSLEKDYVGIRTGRANPAILDSVLVEAYGSSMPINQVATVSCPEPRLIMVQPFDKNNLSAIEKAIQKADLSLNPSSDGNVIRIQIPELTEERRKELVKYAKQKAEEAKVAVRNIRRDSNDLIKELEKGKEISEDDSKREQDTVQKITDTYIEKLSDLAANKEKEILSI